MQILVRPGSDNTARGSACGTGSSAARLGGEGAEDADGGASVLRY